MGPAPRLNPSTPPPPIRGDVKGDESAAISSIVRKKSEPLNSAHSSLCGSSQSTSFAKKKKREPAAQGGEDCASHVQKNGCGAAHVLMRSQLHALPIPMLSLAKPPLICRRGSGRRGCRGGGLLYTKAPSHILPPIFSFFSVHFL